MVEPQEPKPSEQIITNTQSFNQQQSQVAAGLPAEIIAKAQSKVESFAELKSRIDPKIKVLKEQLEDIRGLIKGNSQSQAIPDGLLTRGENKYLDCFDLKHDEFEELLRADEAHWTEFLEMSRRQADEIQQQISAILEKQRKEIESLLNKSFGAFSQEVRPKITLRKLQMWGEWKDSVDKVNFEWPTLELLQNLPANIHLKSIQFKTEPHKYSLLSSVQCTLTDQTKSPVFEKAGVNHDYSQVIEIDQGRPIRKVQASGFAIMLSFCDAQNNQVYAYNPRNRSFTDESLTRVINDNEEIIGVYGIKDVANYLHGFGFILRTNHA